jgi:uncharacterized protein YbjQ (UPF0145 family)
MDLYITLGSFVVFMILGYIFGSLAERKHYRSIIEREEQYRKLIVVAQRFPFVPNVKQTVLVTGSVVISVDYFKRFLASLRMLVGVRLTSYESLLDRARREAILRLQEQADSHHAKSVYNLKFETSSISKGAKDRVGSIEVLAYGTALICE